VAVSAASGKQAFDAVVQRDAPDANRGRSFARFESRFQVVWVLGAAVPVVIAIYYHCYALALRPAPAGETRRAALILIALGLVFTVASRFVQFTALSADDLNQIMTTYAGVGEILAIVYDINGRPCAPDYANRVVGLTIQELERIPFRIGAAGTATKSLPIYGALRGGFFHTIITDEAAAHGVLDIHAKEFRNDREGIAAAG